MNTTIEIEDVIGLRSVPFYNIEWLETGMIPLAEAERFGEWCRAQEREACARLCENYTGLDSDTVSDILAEAIRARGQE